MNDQIHKKGHPRSFGFELSVACTVRERPRFFLVGVDLSVSSAFWHTWQQSFSNSHHFAVKVEALVIV